VVREQEERHKHIICIASWVGAIADRAVEKVEEVKACEARLKESRLRELQLLRAEREKWEIQGVGVFMAHQAVEAALHSATAIATIKQNHPLQTASICSSLMKSIVESAAKVAVDRDKSLVAFDLIDDVLKIVHIQAEKRMYSDNIILREKARIASSSTKVPAPPPPLLLSQVVIRNSTMR
jgi:hypothetical protein